MENVTTLVVFLEGILSFLSPCVLPILPVYFSVLANSEGMVEDLQSVRKNRLIGNTILFVFGIATIFFMMGFAMTFIGKVVEEYSSLLRVVGSIFIILMGLFYLGYLNISFLQRERKIQYRNRKMKGISAYLLGLTFSFGWTPCIGPMLASVLVMVSAADNHFIGILYIAIYTLGFALPFILLAIFYKGLYRFVDTVKKYTPWIQKIGGILLIVMGIMMLIQKQEVPNITIQENSQDKVLEEQIQLPDFELMDQYGNTHTLSEYKGKTIFLNFWATWCPPCRGEMPEIEKIYEKYGKNKEDVIILGIVTPNLGKEKSKEDIITFLEDNEYYFPTLFDSEGMQMYLYNVNAFPTTVIIDKEGQIANYIPGAMNEDTMEEMIEQAR